MNARIYPFPAVHYRNLDSPTEPSVEPADRPFRLVIGRYRLTHPERLLRAIASVLLVDTGASIVIGAFALYHLFGAASGVHPSGTAEHLVCQAALAVGTLVMVAGVVLGMEGE